MGGHPHNFQVPQITANTYSQKRKEKCDMKLILLTTTLPSLAFGFSVNGNDLLRQGLSMQVVAGHHSPAYQRTLQQSSLSRLSAHTPRDIDEAFEELQRELNEGKSAGTTDDVASKSKKWINRYFDLFAGINRDLTESEEEVMRSEKALRKQQELTNKVIDFAFEFGKDLSSLDLDGLTGPGRKIMKNDLGNSVQPSRGSSFEPIYTIQDDDQMFRAEIELPGVNIEDVTIELEQDNLLAVSGQRPSIGNGKPAKFAKRFVLDPRVTVEKLSATLDKGILTVSAPKAGKEDSKRRISITPGK